MHQTTIQGLKVPINQQAAAFFLVGDDGWLETRCANLHPEPKAVISLVQVIAAFVSALLLDKPGPPRPDCLMRSFRILLALLIALALPAQVLADARMAIDCCPVSSGAEFEALSIGHDCCHEHDTEETGKSCDAGSCCPCGAHLALTLHVFLTATHERARTLAVFSTPRYPAPPDAHWRPPAPMLP